MQGEAVDGWTFGIRRRHGGFWILPPRSDLTGFEAAFDYPCVVTLRGSQEVFPIYGREYVVVANVTIFRPREKVGHAWSSSEGMCRYRVR